MEKLIEKVMSRVKVVVIFTATLLLTACAEAVAAEPARSQLKILYVGIDPNQPLTEGERSRVPNPDRHAALRKTRTPDFKAFLTRYFETVDVVYGVDFKESMSDKYDVTIIDTYLRVKSGGWGVDPETGERVYNTRKFLSEEFSAATIMIGEPSAFIGEGRELKIDHLCLCLDAHAHGMKLEHPIFNAPYKVDVSYEERETPGNYKTRYSGRHLDETMPMWRIQTEGYGDGKGFPVGLVSTGYGFDNGLDAEWISGGRNDKGVNSTAIGRHANFFHWGFAAAPEYMTDSAKLAFINSIHYIAQFKGSPQITRKIKGVELSQYRREKQWTLSDQGATAWLAYLEKGRQDFMKRQAELQAKKDAGEALSPLEESLLGYPDRPKETREWTIRKEPETLKQQFGSDWAAYEQYYIDNSPYFYAVEGGWHESTLDEEAKAMGIAVGDIRLLDKAIEMMEMGERTEVAQTLLTRYTKQSFETAKEWSNWLGQNREKLYFSEGDGYKFIVIP